MCHKHKDTCEAAHLDPVAKSFNNHPENLLWLCSNQHTAYDKGLYGPRQEDADFVLGFKISLLLFQTDNVDDAARAQPQIVRRASNL
jgi:HNH endonuclease